MQQFTENYDTLLLGIEMSRKTLYSRINKRVDIMLDADYLEKCNNLLNKAMNLAKVCKLLDIKN